MSKLKLVVGTKNLSSWSLRPWLFLRQHGIEFEETVIELDQDDTEAEILRHSPSGKVPVLIDGGLRVWESLAICEYAAEKFSLRYAWPSDLAARACARSIACEMHAGFAAARREMPFKAARRPDATTLTAEARADIARICAIWREARTRFGRGGDFLFGEFGIADAMFAPVAVRLRTYAVALDGPEDAYAKALLSLLPMREWIGTARTAGWPRNRAAAVANGTLPALQIKSHLLPP